MKPVILDTSFILTAVKQKIDFFDKLEKEGISVIIPEQAIKELEGLGAKLALKILNLNSFKIVKFPGKDADTAIINFAKKNPKALVATLDQGMMKKLKNRKMIIRQKKKIEII